MNIKGRVDLGAALSVSPHKFVGLTCGHAPPGTHPALRTQSHINIKRKSGFDTDTGTCAYPYWATGSFRASVNPVFFVFFMPKTVDTQ